MKRELDIKVGKTYNIKHLIEELKEHPDIMLGHVYALNKHEYRLGFSDLEKLQKMIKKADIDGVVAYDLFGKRKVDTSDIYVLNILDPFTKYQKYEKFYEELFRNIESGIDASSSGVILALSQEIISEAEKMGFEIEKTENLFGGILIYFERRGIESIRMKKGEGGERKDYFAFAREGTIKREEQGERKPDTGKGKLISMSEHETKLLKEKTKEFEPFYSELEPIVVAFIKQSNDKSAAVKIEEIIKEAKKTIGDAVNKKDILLKGMILYFHEKGISAEIKKDEKNVYHMIFGAL